MNGLLKRGVSTLLGLLVMIGWWTLRGSDSNVEEASRIPSTVWGGGAGRLDIEVTTSAAATFYISFNENSDDGRELDAYEKIEAGTHTWTIDVPHDVGGTVELTAVHPEQGDTLRWQIRLNGEVVDEQSDELPEPLEDGYAFFIQSYYDDYASAEQSPD